MQLKDSLDAMKFDARLVELHIKNGTITKADYKKHLDSLEDLAHLSEKVSIGDGYDDEDEDDMDELA